MKGGREGGRKERGRKGGREGGREGGGRERVGGEEKEGKKNVWTNPLHPLLLNAPAQSTSCCSDYKCSKVSFSILFLLPPSLTKLINFVVFMA